MSEKCNTSIKAAKSVLDAINIYFEMLNMRETKECLDMNGAEISSYKENFSMFLTHLSPVELKIY